MRTATIIEKTRAHAAVRMAIEEGTLIRLRCEECESLNTGAHHDDYSKPLKVRFLCPVHHAEADRLRREVVGPEPVGQMIDGSLVVTAVEAKMAFGELIAHVRAGGVVTVTHYGKPVVEMRRPDDAPAQPLASSRPQCDGCRSWAQQSRHSPHGTCRNERSEYYADDMASTDTCDEFEAKS